MQSKLFIFLLILILSFSNSLLYSSEDFQQIQFMTPTKFKINYNQSASFKYKLETQKQSIGLKFLIANLYTVNVSIYTNYEDTIPIFEYKLAINEFKEINVTNFDEYVYIVIKETNPYYHYEDYLTIYDSEKPIHLEHNKVISINNFLTNNKYNLIYSPSDKNIILTYNTQNFENNKRKISINYGDDKIIENSEEPTYNKFLNLTKTDNLIITIENKFENNEDNNDENQEFSIIIYEVNQETDFNEIKQNQIEIINYIYNNDSKLFYFYSNITSFQNYNTFNFKLNFEYFQKKDSVKLLANIIGLDNEITQEDLHNNIPTTNSLPFSYDPESDEYLRIYFKNVISDKKYSYLLVSIGIEEEQYYYGNKVLEVSMGNQVEQKYDFSNIEPYKQQKLEISTLNYIPYYSKLKLNSNQKYLLTCENKNQFISTFIKGDLINSDNTINTNYLDISNEIIILSNIEELTLKLFGPNLKAIFNIEKIDDSNFVSFENNRIKNDIIPLEMKENQTKYILGTYNYDEYAYGISRVNYYASIENGEFDLYFKNNITYDESSIFPSDEKYSQKFDEIIDLKTNLDIFKVVCKADGKMYIRPQYKIFDEATFLIEENGHDIISMNAFSGVIQLSSPLKRSDNLLYFSILFINSQNIFQNLNEDDIKIDISPDVEGAFEKGSISSNQIFQAAINLSKYRNDELAIHIQSNVFNNEIEIIEKVSNKYTSYTEIKQGENKDIISNNILFPISIDKQTLYINIENLKDKIISYGIIQSSLNDTNYITIADKYEKSIKKEIKESKEKIILNNAYYNITDELRPYTFFLLSILNQEDNLKYNVKIDFKDEEPSPPLTDNNNGDDDGDDNTKTIIIIVVVVVAVLIIVVGIIVFKFCLKRNRSSSDIEKISSESIHEIV